MILVAYVMKYGGATQIGRTYRAHVDWSHWLASGQNVRAGDGQPVIRRRAA